MVRIAKRMPDSDFPAQITLEKTYDTPWFKIFRNRYFWLFTLQMAVKNRFLGRKKSKIQFFEKRKKTLLENVVRRPHKKFQPNRSINGQDKGGYTLFPIQMAVKNRFFGRKKSKNRFFEKLKKTPLYPLTIYQISHKSRKSVKNCKK